MQLLELKNALYALLVHPVTPHLQVLAQTAITHMQVTSTAEHVLVATNAQTKQQPLLNVLMDGIQLMLTKHVSNVVQVHIAHLTQ